MKTVLASFKDEDLAGVITVFDDTDIVYTFTVVEPVDGTLAMFAYNILVDTEHV